MGILIRSTVLTFVCFVQFGIDAQGRQGFCYPPPIVRNQRSMLPPPNMRNRKYSLGSQVTYTCRSGYRMTGTATVSCANRRWRYDKNLGVPRCLAIAPTGTSSKCYGGCRYPNRVCELVFGRPRCICRPGYFDVRGRCEPRSSATTLSPESCYGKCPLNTDCGLFRGRKACICKVGYFLLGRSCAARPNINVPVTTTSPPLVTCSRPAESVNRVTLPDRNQQTWRVGERIIYGCEGGYILSGNRRSTCQSNGKFQSSPPKCLFPSSTVIPRVTPSATPANVICSNAAAPINGFTTPIGQVVFAVGSTVRFRCNGGYILFGSTAAVCQNNGQFSAYSNECRPVTTQAPTPSQPCIIPVAPQNGQITPASRPVWLPGNTVRYSCNEGFTLVGAAVATCLGTGQFTSGPPVCQGGVRCPPPVVPFGGDIEQPTKSIWVPGDIVTYSCRSGFTLIGGPTITCQNNGLYSDPFPSCGAMLVTTQSVVCTNPPVPTNGFSTPQDKTEWTVGEKVTFACNAGLLLVGKNTATCQSDGSFTDARIFCIVPQTPPPTDPPTPPTPPPFVPVCTRPADPANGRLLSNRQSFAVHEVAEFACNEGFILVGSNLIGCMSTGDFNDRPPVCVGTIVTPSVTSPPAVTCPRPSPPANGNILASVNQLTWHVGERLAYNCFGGYNLVGREDVICLQDGTFSGVAPQCIVVTTGTQRPLQPIVVCPRPSAPSNGNILAPASQQTWQVGKRLSYNCFGGYNLVGSEDVICQDDGTFNDVTPQCIAVPVVTPAATQLPPSAIVCTRLSAPSNGNILSPANQQIWQVGERILFNCFAGFNLVGREDLICQPEGNFDGVPPQCVAVSGSVTTCLTPPPPIFGVITNPQSVWNVGDPLLYSCNVGFEMVGGTTATCLPTGEFSPPPPMCIATGGGAVTCSVLPPMSGSIVGGATVVPAGQIVQFQCNARYTLVGESSIMCREDGALANEPPQCTACTPEPPLNGILLPVGRRSWNFTDLVNYGCEDGYTLRGLATGFCAVNGVVVGSTPTCLSDAVAAQLRPVFCSPTPPENGFVNPTVVRANQLYDYGCDEGYRLDGFNVGLCLLSGNVAAVQPPSCKKL